MIAVLIIFFVCLMLLIIAGFCSAARTTPKPRISAEQFYAAMSDLMTPGVRLDPADDGIEVLVIRTEMMADYGGALYWSDPATKKVLPRPMGLYEIMDTYGCERG